MMFRQVLPRLSRPFLKFRSNQFSSSACLGPVDDAIPTQTASSAKKEMNSTKNKQRNANGISNHVVQEINVAICTSQEEASKWVQTEVIDKNIRAIGFDAEWNAFESHHYNSRGDAHFGDKVTRRGGMSQRVALIQIATPTSALLARLNIMKGIPSVLADVMKSDDIIKCGVGVRDDLSYLTRDFGISYGGYCDVSRAASSINGAPNGLYTLANFLLGLDLSKKSKRVALSNWERSTLTDKQIRYAALDAMLGLHIYERLLLLGKIPKEDV
jgi:hypothetical protein